MQKRNFWEKNPLGSQSKKDLIWLLPTFPFCPAKPRTWKYCPQKPIFSQMGEEPQSVPGWHESAASAVGRAKHFNSV